MPVAIPVLPESAPFTPAQRAWLNGFFAGLVGWRGGATDLPAPAESAPAPAPAEPAAEESFPWHDAALNLEERLKLAEGKSHDRVLMAAMAQLDCGACGYVCQTYAEAIARGEEKDLTKCAPGGRETSRKLKELTVNGKPVGAAAAAAPSVDVQARTAAPAAPSKPGYGRSNPYPARLLSCAPLNRTGSAKDTRHVVFDLKGSPVSYKVGDSLGVYPENCPDTVQWILEALDASGAEPVAAPDGSIVTLHEALLRHYTVTQPSPELVELLSAAATDDAERAALKAMAEDADGTGVPPGEEVLDLLTHYPSARPSPEKLVAALPPMRPRLYSISSSPVAHPGEVHLTVGVVRFVNGRGRQCKGVASTFLGERVRPGQKVRLFVQPSHGFGLPTDGNTPVVMVGPGTGIAPFRAFLHERRASGAKGRNWLLFGDQKRACDFLYEEEVLSMQRDGFLTRLDTAFSRDQAEKVYVQQRMLENGPLLWQWLNEGAHFYVCGDAKRMAADVDDALRKVVAEQGGLSPESAKAFVADLAKARRYQRDVY